MESRFLHAISVTSTGCTVQICIPLSDLRTRESDRPYKSNHRSMGMVMMGLLCTLHGMSWRSMMCADVRYDRISFSFFCFLKPAKKAVLLRQTLSRDRSGTFNQHVTRSCSLAACRFEEMRHILARGGFHIACEANLDAAVRRPAVNPTLSPAGPWRA